jgi:hypothetical protein
MHAQPISVKAATRTEAPIALVDPALRTRIWKILHLYELAAKACYCAMAVQSFTRRVSVYRPRKRTRVVIDKEIKKDITLRKICLVILEKLGYRARPRRRQSEHSFWPAGIGFRPCPNRITDFVCQNSLESKRSSCQKVG